jgi:hypothetical protein
MKRPLFFPVIILALLLAVPACEAGTVTSSPNPSAAGQPSVSVSALPSSTASAASANIDYAALGMDAAAIQQWDQQGIASVATAAQASVLAGFTVIEPGFVPGGLTPQKYMVSDHGAALRAAGMQDAVKFIDVSRFYLLEGQRTPVLSFIESTNALNNGQAPVTELCGITVEKLALPADSGNPAGFQYVWARRDLYYLVIGYLAGGITEADLDNVVCSIINP